MSKRNLLDLTAIELKKAMQDLGLPAYRGDQIFAWIYQKGIARLEDMTNLPKGLREELCQDWYIGSMDTETVQVSKTDGTRKYLFRLSDGNAIESVLMRYHYGNTLCLSTQAGCRMGCQFCASTMEGLVRGLTAGEMVEQLLRVQQDTGERIGHLVLMGTGEPFDNYGEVAQFLRLAHEPGGLGISYRNMTVSTCGIVPQLSRFGEEFGQVGLAISLHGATNVLRDRLMPVNRSYPLEVLLPAVKTYTEKTGRRVTFEYLLLGGVNDRAEDLTQLIKALGIFHTTSGWQCHVNLIPWNRVSGKGYKPVSRQKAEAFCQQLNQAGIPATVRRELGSDIDAACGQLRLGKTGN